MDDFSQHASQFQVICFVITKQPTVGLLTHLTLITDGLLEEDSRKRTLFHESRLSEGTTVNVEYQNAHTELYRTLKQHH